jgi:signal transduction histidine kinase
MRLALGPFGGDQFVARPQASLTQTQFEHRTWWLLGLAIFLIFCFCVTIPTLYVALARSGVLGDRLPAATGGALLIGLIGLTAVFCLLMVRQQAEINRIRRRMLLNQMDLEQSRGRLAELTSLFQLGNSLHMNLPLETILEITVRRVASTLHSHDAALFLYDPATRTLTQRAAFGLTPRGPEPEVKLGEGPVGWAARHQEPLLLRAAEKGARFVDFFQTHPDAGSALVLPVTHDGRCLAVLQVCRALKADPLRLDHRDIGKLFADNVAPVIDRAQAMVKLRQVASRTAAESVQEVPGAENAATFRDAFLTSASTELKSPLTTIIAYSEVLDQNDRRMTPAMRLEFSSRVRSEAQRMLHLIDDVIDLVRLELGRYLLDLHVDNVNSIAKSAVEAIRPLASSHEITLEVALEDSIPDQHVDPEKLRQSILHLLRNAIRFSPAKSTVGLSTSLDDEGVLIEIRDAGPALEPEIAAALFELDPMGSSRGRRSQDGLGFGLHLARRFVEMHGGSVGAGPAPGGGTAFWVRLPRGEDISKIFGADPYVEELARQ